MALIVTCKQCGEKNDITKFTDWLRKKVNEGRLFVYQIPTLDDATMPRCTNCHIVLTLERKRDEI